MAICHQERHAYYFLQTSEIRNNTVSILSIILQRQSIAVGAMIMHSYLSSNLTNRTYFHLERYCKEGLNITLA